MKEVDLDKTLYDITEQYPELIPVLKDLGFAGVANPVLRNTHARVMTLRKGCEHLGKDLAEVVKTLEQKGYSVKK